MRSKNNRRSTHGPGKTYNKCYETQEKIKAFCEDKLADFKRPRDIRFVESLPTTLMGKIDKRAIREIMMADCKN